jgi:hypothetical protein
MFGNEQMFLKTSPLGGIHDEACFCPLRTACTHHAQPAPHTGTPQADDAAADKQHSLAEAENAFATPRRIFVGLMALK